MSTAEGIDDGRWGTPCQAFGVRRTRPRIVGISGSGAEYLLYSTVFALATPGNFRRFARHASSPSLANLTSTGLKSVGVDGRFSLAG